MPPLEDCQDPNHERFWGVLSAKDNCLACQQEEVADVFKDLQAAYKRCLEENARLKLESSCLRAESEQVRREMSEIRTQLARHENDLSPLWKVG